MNCFEICAEKVGEESPLWPLLMGLANTWAINPDPFNFHQFSDLTTLPDDPAEAVLALLGWWRDSEGYNKLAELLR